MDYPILVINLNRSKERLKKVEDQLGKGSFIRIEGVDGRQWESGELDAHGRPRWKLGVKEEFKQQGILGKVKVAQLTPCEIACALSHKKAWEYVIENNLERAVILEDDFTLTEKFKGSFKDSVDAQKGMPADADVMFLFGKDCKASFFVLDKKNRIISGQCNAGYIITLEGAKKAIKAQFPMYLPCDVQWWRVAFSTMDFKLELGGVERGNAYAVKKSIITTDPYMNPSTMTPSGIKPWQLKKD